WVAIYTGAGDKAFCAGNDLKYTAEHGFDAIKESLLSDKAIKGGFGGITMRFDCFKPIIAAVNGYAGGGGTEIALACDLIIAAEHAKFGLPEPRVGLMAGAGGVHRLPRQLPTKIAMGMMLTGKMITAKQAFEYGLVNEVVPGDRVLDTAERWATEIMECAPLAVMATKQSALQGLDRPTLEQAMKPDYPMFRKVMDSEDVLEGSKAFAEKRKPQWKCR
ncbi:MAG: enoyl-CoA hydratase-related protein, partial [Desulfobacteraceae bacterium]